MLSFPAHNHQEAQTLLKEEWLRGDLKALKSAGRPLWDGKDKLTVRMADAAEAAKFDREAKDLPPDADADLSIVYHVTLY